MGAVQMLGRGRLGRREKQEALAAGNRSPHLRHAVTWIPLCHGSSGQTGSSSADSQPWMLRPVVLGPPPPQKRKVEGRPVQAAEVTTFYSPQLFLSFWFLAMVVQGLVAVRRCHRALSSPGPQVAGSGRLCARAGRSMLRL